MDYTYSWTLLCDIEHLPCPDKDGRTLKRVDKGFDY